MINEAIVWDNFCCFQPLRGNFKDKPQDTLIPMSGVTVLTLSIGTPYLLTILVLKFEIVHSTTC